MPPKKLRLQNKLSPGDVLVMSVLPRELHKQYPGKFTTSYDGTAPELLSNNPYIVKQHPDDEIYQTTYSGVHRSNQNRYHFMHAYLADFNDKFGTKLKLTEFKPDLFFTETEKTVPIVNGKYWVINAGGKSDFTTKWWDPGYWQEVVNELKDEVQFVQVGGRGHFHPLLDNVIDLRGKTSLRELARLILHSRGACCTITCTMHMAAACNRPCVITGGGREPPWWEEYTAENRDKNMMLMYGKTPPPQADMIDHIYLHSIGSFDCCRDGGCWRSRLEGKKRCLQVVQGPTIKQPACLASIKPASVVSGIRTYEAIGMSSRYAGLSPQTINDKERPTMVNMNQAMNLPVTICVLLYGPYFELHERCLNSIVANTPRGMYTLRIGSNCVGTDTLDLVKKLADDGHVEHHIHSEENIKKYPMMRRLFRYLPIRTDWTLWFDDDSYITKDDWLQRLSIAVADGLPQKHVIYGKPYIWHLKPGEREFIESAPWYRGVPIQTYHHRCANGKVKERDRINFVTGGFWALKTDVIYELDWPDPRLVHNGGDTKLCEALRQHGYKMHNFTYGVEINKHDRRGYSEPPAGAARC